MKSQLPTNNTTCTTKNFKMMAAVIYLTAVFVFANIAVFAQATETIDNAVEVKTPAKTEMKVVQKEEVKRNPAPQVGTYSPAEKVDPNSNLPYYHYKGITNLEEAKKLWIAENPEAYKNAQGKGTSDFKATNVSQKQEAQTGNGPSGASLKSSGVQQNNNTPAQNATVVKTTNGQLPNADRRLPADYDDSKSNNKTK